MAGDSREVYYGTIGFRGTRVPINTMDQGLPRIGSGQEIERSAQIGLTKIRFSSLDGGLVSVTGIQPWAQVITSYVQNNGLQTRIPRQVTLPYRLVAQATLDAVNHSGSVAANIRGHAANTSLGATGLRYIYLVKNYVFTDTTLTDPAIVELANTVLTDTVTAIEPNAIFNNVAYFAAAYNGATEDVQGFTDVTTVTYTTGWTKLVTLAADDYLNAMRTMQTLGTGVNIFVGMINGTNQVWYSKTTSATLPQTSSTLQACVVADTKDELGSLTAQTTGEITLTLSDDYDPTASEFAWGTNNATDPRTYGYKWAYVTTDTGIPDSAFITGLQPDITYSETGASTLNSAGVRIAVGGSIVSPGFGALSNITGTENSVLGSTTDPLGTALRGSDANSLALRIGKATTAGGSGNYFQVTAADINIGYTMPGTSIAFPLGGWQTSPSQAFPNRIAMVAPERTDKILITVPRKLWFLDFEWDTAGDRPVFTPSVVDTNMRYIHHAAPWQGGYAVTGGSIAGPGKFLRHIDGSGNVRNLGMPRTNNGEWLCNAIHPQGSWLVLDMVKSDYTDRQWWLYNNGKYYPDTLKQSLGPAAIASQPIPFAEQALGAQQQQAYSFYPVSTTHLAAIRQFLPEDLDTSPLLINTSEVKSMAYTGNSTEDAFLTLVSPEMDFGPEEALKTIVQGFAQSRLISAAGGASGSVQSELSIDGASSFNSTLTKEFTAFNTEYAVTGSGVAYDTIAHRLGLKHEAATAKTPNGANVLWTSVQQWEQREFIDIEVDNSSLQPDVFSLLSAISTLQATKNVQPLRVGNKTWHAVFEGMYGRIKVPPRGQPPTLEQHRDVDPKTGNATDLAIVFRFRSTPGAA